MARGARTLPTTVRQLVPELFRRLHAILTKLNRIAESTERGQEELVEKLSRALLLAGEGDKFNPAIRRLVATLRESRAGMRAVAGLKTLKEHERDDLSARFERFAEEAECSLYQMGARIETAPLGAALDKATQKVVEERLTCDAAEVGTIAACLHSRVVWTNGSGGQSQEPAEVAVYVAQGNGKGKLIVGE